ncbi:hypothetical protein [Pontiella sp.]|uniref:ABC-type transport auxiliary lipoprotein family protein n=1 Tax=Pontiella sp. TaxID=2837462 RepID=UPI003567D977
MKMQRIVLLPALAASVLLVSGCVKLWHKNLDIKTYMIEAKRDAAPLETARAGKLWIESVHVLPPYNIRNLILRENEVEFSTGYYAELLMSPSENFRNGFYGWLADSGIFEHVSVVERRGMSHRLVATVMDFYGDVASGKAVLRIKVSLFDEKAADVGILMSNGYRREVDIASGTAEDLIRAYNEAFRQILAACEQDILAALD